MKTLITTLALFILSISGSHAEEEPTLGDFVDNLLHTHDLAVACAGHENAKTHIPVYIAKLAPKKNRPEFTQRSRYALARHFLDCHHLCQAFYHQTYILGEDLPVFALLEEAFPGFRAETKWEGGVWLRGVYEFLQKRDLFTGKPKPENKAAHTNPLPRSESKSE